MVTVTGTRNDIVFRQKSRIDRRKAQGQGSLSRFQVCILKN